MQVHLRDFVVRMKEFESTDNTGLFAEEEEAKRIAAQQAEAQRIAAVRQTCLLEHRPTQPHTALACLLPRRYPVSCRPTRRFWMTGWVMNSEARMRLSL